MRDFHVARLFAGATLLALALTGCNDGGGDVDVRGDVSSDTGDDDNDNRPRAQPLASTRSRSVPAQGQQLVTNPPLRHAKAPSDNEPQNPNTTGFVDRETGEPVSEFPNLGTFEQGAPSPRVTRNELVAASPVVAAADEPASVYWMLHMSDMQVVDEESPGLIPASKFAIPQSRLRPIVRRTLISCIPPTPWSRRANNCRHAPATIILRYTPEMQSKMPSATNWTGS
jgi:hypothetical protein